MVPNWANRTLFHGDNLKFLRSMNSESVDLIATDPPFNKGRDFHATPDSLAKGASFQDRWSWETDVHQEWVDQITDDHPNVMNVVQGSRSSYGDDMGAFLCFMAVRLLAMSRVLKPTGSIYLHCDPTASHYLKELMDSVFGRKNFRNEIVWHYQGWNKRLRTHIERRHDILLFYSQSKGSAFNYPTRPWDSKDEYIRVRKQRVRADENGREYVLSDAGSGKRVKRYLDDAMRYGVPLDDVWRIDKINNSDKIEACRLPDPEAPRALRTDHPRQQQQSRRRPRPIRRLRHNVRGRRTARPPVGRHRYLGQGARDSSQSTTRRGRAIRQGSLCDRPAGAHR